MAVCVMPLSVMAICVMAICVMAICVMPFCVMPLCVMPLSLMAICRIGLLPFSFGLMHSWFGRFYFKYWSLNFVIDIPPYTGNPVYTHGASSLFVLVPCIRGGYLRLSILNALSTCWNASRPLKSFFSIAIFYSARCRELSVVKPTRLRGVPSKKSAWIKNWGLLESMGFVTSVKFGV